MKKNGIVSVMTFSNKERLSKLFGEHFSYKFKKWNLEKMKDSEFILISYEINTFCCNFITFSFKIKYNMEDENELVSG